MRMLTKDASYRFRAASDLRVALERVPTPFDWAAATRRLVAVGAVGVSMSACLGIGGLGAMVAKEVLSTDPTSVPTPPPATATATPKVAPKATAAPTVEPESTKINTSTPVPTGTPTATPSSTGVLVDTPAPSGSSLKEDS